ncbi:MAG: tetratricopeptide repeat protein [Ignavibacteria bacterium]|nr:tetratricopeptide repeat protein [Ignavibacteria bacterium]
MKSKHILLILASFLALLVFQGFQCASAEFTGAKVQIQQKNFAEAKRLLEIEVQKNPMNDEAWYLLGLLRADDEEYEGMNEAFNKANELTDKHAVNIQQTRYNTWGQLINAGVQYLDKASPESTMYYDTAAEEFTKATRAWPDTSLTYRYLGYAYNNKGDFDKALEVFRQAWSLGKDYESLKRIGRIHLLRADESKTKFETTNVDALDLSRKLGEVRRHARREDVIQFIGQPDERKRGPRGTKIETWIYKAYNLEVTIDDTKVSATKYTAPFTPKIDSTDYRRAMEQYAQAVNAFETARESDPKDKETLNLLLRAYIESQRISEATRTFQVAVDDEPDNKLNRYVLGVLYRTMGRYEEAINQFVKAAELDPEYADAIFELGATYYNWGVEILREAEDRREVTTAHKEKFRSALPHMEKVSKLKADDPAVWETLGTIYAQLDRQDDAIAAFNRADAIRAGK